MRSTTNNAVSAFRLRLAVTVAFVFGAVSSAAADLAAIHLPGKIAPDAEVGLALSSQHTLYVAYWVEAEHDQPWKLMLYEFNIASGKVGGTAELDKAQPLRSRNGDAIQSVVRLWISPDGSMLLCMTLEQGPIHKAWTLSSHGLHILSGRTIPADTNLLGFAENGDVRLLRVRTGGKFGQEIDSAAVLTLKAQSLDSVAEQVIHFTEPAWRLTAAGPDNLLWVLDERASPHGEARITAYGLQNGQPVGSREVSLAEAEVGAPAVGPRPEGNDLPPPTAIPQPGLSRDAPQLAQMMAASQMVLGVVHQPVEQWKTWSRVVLAGLPPLQITWSSVLSGCNLMLSAVGRSGRLATGACDLIGRARFDQYAIKKSDAVFVSTQTGTIVAVLPLNIRRPPLSLAIDDTVDPAIAAIYDRGATVRVASISAK
jgi:hypothetical protein